MNVKPNFLVIDACVNCQLKCTRCPVTTMGYDVNLSKGYLKFNYLKSIIDSNPQILRIYFDNFGELLLNPDLTKIVEYAFINKIELYCNVGVNLNNATTEQLEALVKYRFKSLTCAIDGATENIYQIYRVGGKLNKVLDNIRTINNFKKKYNSNFPKLRWQFIVFGHNEHEIPMAKKLAEELNMEFYPKLNWDSEYSPIKDKKFVKKHTGLDFVTREEFEKLEGKSFNRKTCYSLWYSPRINVDGKVSGCCWNVWSDFGGNVFRDGYVNCINSEKLNYAKQVLLGKKQIRPDIPCSTCEIYLKIKNDGQYLAKYEILSSHPAYNFINMLTRLSGFKWVLKLYKGLIY